MKLGVVALCECALETGDAICVCVFELGDIICDTIRP